MDYPKSDPTVGLVGGKFSDGDAVGGVSASRDPAAWANAMTDELLAVIVAAGLTPDEADLNQVLDALVLLGLRTATTTLTGVVELATDAEAVAGASAVLAVAPTGLLAALTGYLPKRVFSLTDYIRIPDVPGGLIIQWGTVAATGNPNTFTLPCTFPTAGLRAFATFQDNSTARFATAAIFSASQVTATGRTDTGAVVTTGEAIQIFAIGN